MYCFHSSFSITVAPSLHSRRRFDPLVGSNESIMHPVKETLALLSNNFTPTAPPLNDAVQKEKMRFFISTVDAAPAVM